MLEAVRPGSIKLDRLDASEDWFAETADQMSIAKGERIVDICVKDLIDMYNE